MVYTVEYHPDVPRGDIPRLPKDIQMRVVAAIEQKLETNPLAFGVSLRRALKNYRKLRVGDYRIIFCMLPKNIVYILIIRHRKDVYDIAQKRA